MLNHIIEAFHDAQFSENLMIEIVLLVTELQQVGNGVLKRADPDLQSAAVTDERTDVKRDQIFSRAYGFIRCAEEREIVFRFVDNSVVPSPFAQSAVLIRKLTKAKRPWLALGESYRIPGSFRVTLTKAAGGQAEVRFR